jgi:hypothetical protein
LGTESERGHSDGMKASRVRVRVPARKEEEAEEEADSALQLF